LVATTEYAVEAKVPVGVPEITQVEVFRLSPTERAGEAVQLVMAAPLLFNTIGVTDIAVPTLPEVPVEPV
jgi:hypothetical protein